MPARSLLLFRRCRQLLLALSLGLGLTTHAPQALAEPTQERADALFLQGKAAAQAKNWNEAHRLLSLAWQLKQSYDIASNLGQVAYLLGKHAEAAQHVAFALRHYPPTADADQKAKAQSLLELVRQEVASLHVSVSHPDAEVFVDGQPQGRASELPPELFVEPGPRRVVARLADESVQRDLQTKTGGDYRVQLDLSPQNPGEPPPAAASVPPPAAAQPGPATADTPPPGSSRSTGLEPKTMALIAGGGLTLASVVGLTVSSIQHARAADRVDAYGNKVGGGDPSACLQGSGDCEKLKQAADDWEQSGQLQNIFLAASLGFAGATVVTYLVWPDSSEQSAGSARLQPLITPQTRALVLSGSF